MKVGDLVKPKNRMHQLVSGCGRYPRAVVVRLDPFAMVSEEADMLWNCREERHFEVIGEAAPEILEKCMKRIE